MEAAIDAVPRMHHTPSQNDRYVDEFDEVVSGVESVVPVSAEAQDTGREALHAATKP